MSGILTRKSCWFVKDGCKCKYKYGKMNKYWEPNVFPDWMHEISEFVEKEMHLAQGYFNSCNANFYETSNHDLYFHSDNEALFRTADAPTSKREVTIASVSFGATRMFTLQLNYSDGTSIETLLHDGDLLSMEGLLQDNWSHAISKAKKTCEAASSSQSDTGNARFNLTFRRIPDSKHGKECNLKAN